MDSRELERKAVMDTAAKMAAAIRTAPKGCGVDEIETLVLTGDEKDALGEEMRKITAEGELDFYKRDADFLELAEAIILVAVHNKPLMLTGCGYCGHKNCEENMKAGGHCSFKTIDLGIAVGSAVSIAADNRIDNRVWFSAGVAAKRLNLFEADDIHAVIGIPLAVRGKNPFFMRDDELESLLG